MADVIGSELGEMTNHQLVDMIKKLQSQIKFFDCSESHCEIKHELEVHQIELEMQNRALRESQIQLEQARDSYADLYDFAPVSYITFDEKGIIDNINLTGASLLGDVRGNIVDRPFTIWLKKDNLKIFFKHLKSTLHSDVKITSELQITTRNGELLDIRIESIRSQYLTDNAYFCRSVILDNTEANRIKNEIILQSRQLELITDALPVLIAYIDASEHHLFANKTYIESFDGLANGIIGKSAYEVWGEDNYENVGVQLKLALSGHKVKFDMELPLGNAGKKYFHTILIPDCKHSSEVNGVIVLIGDITDRLAIEAIDRKRLLDVAHFSRLSSMGEMVSEIAHELNQPLAAISIYSDACRRMLESGKGEKADIVKSLSDIGFQAERAGAVIRRIREFVSNKETHQTNIDLNDLVQGALQLLEIEVRSHGVQLKLSYADDIPATLADKILIEQVIFNLVRNALEAMDEIDETKRILKVETSVNKFKEIQVKIDDSGPGLALDKIKIIFDHFLTTKTSGMGMGLAICKSIIDAHHGRIWAVPNDIGGTTLNFTLPLVKG